MVPSYQALDGAPWYHFLHGNVPGHEIDFIYRPDVPQGPLTEQHFSHLARLMKDIEPPASGPYAFAIGNLSRDDTQHEPGHGGVALLFGLRIHGALDHAGRNDPPFAHAIAAIDRELDPATLRGSARAFHRRVLGATGPSGWYRDYVRCATEGPFAARRTLEDYVASFDDLPRPKPSAMGLRWISRDARLPKRVVIVHEDDASFDAVAWCAAKIAAMLYQSDLRWTSISNGREADVPNGISIRFVAQRDLVHDSAERIHRIHDIPEEEAEIARQLFDATAAAPEERPAMQGWRERYPDKRLTPAEELAVDTSHPSDEDSATTPRIGEEQVTPPPPPEPTSAPTVEANPNPREEPEDTLVMAPIAAPTAAAEPDEVSIDCSSFESTTPEPAAKESPAARVDATSDHLDDTPSELRRPRRLLVVAGLVVAASLLALAMAAIPTTAPPELAVPPERGAGAAEEPSIPGAGSPSEDTASTHRSAPGAAVKAPGPAQRGAVKPLPGKPSWPAKGAKRPSGQKQGQGGQRPPSQGAAAQPSTKQVPDLEIKVDTQPSAVFGALRETTPTP